MRKGAGKTTLLRTLATVLPPDSGTVRLLGRDPADHHQRRETRHDLAPLLLPLLALLLGITPLARDLTPVALWLDRSVDVAGSIQLIGPFAAGTAAWTASREHRRTMGDLLASTPRNPWARALATWLVSLGWMVVFYLALCAAFLGITATQATWGGPQWWPAIAGLVALIMCSAAGFALGLSLRTRFVTPLAAVGTLTAPFIVHGTSLQPRAFAVAFRNFMAVSLFVGPGTSPRTATPVQRALALYLLQRAGDPAGPGTVPPSPAITAAEARFGALTPAARTTWLASHLGAVRAGLLTPRDIP